MCEIFESHGKRDLSLGRPSTRGVRVRYLHTRYSDNLWRSALFFVTFIYASSSGTYIPSLSITLSRCVYSPSHLTPVKSTSRFLSVRLPKSRQHLASSILGEIQADILSRAITVTFDHRMTGEWLTLRHQSMNFSLSARYNLQSARRRRRRRLSRRPSAVSLGPTRQPSLPFTSLPYHPCNRLNNEHRWTHYHFGRQCTFLSCSYWFIKSLSKLFTWWLKMWKNSLNKIELN